MRLPSCLWLGLIVSGCLSGTAQAAWEPTVATEFFSWKESTTQQSEFVSEHGTRTSFGMRSAGNLVKSGQWNYEININSWYGTASYQGQTVNLVGPQSPQTFSSYTDYEGGRVQLDLIHPIVERPDSGQVVLEGMVCPG